jgi:hypothetical protein
MKIHEITLFEDRAEHIAQAMKQRLEAAAQQDRAAQEFLGHGPDAVNSVNIVQKLKAMDPNPQGINLQFLANMYSRNQFSLEDGPNVRNSVMMFMQHRNQLAVKDLNAVKSMEQLYSLIQPFEQPAQQPDQQPGTAPTEPASKRGQERQAKEEATVLLDSPNLKIVVPKTEAASCAYGRGTRWCTAYTKSENRFNTYNADGPLYILMAKIGGKDRKFQVHFENGEFMNETNTPVNKAEISGLSAIPEYKKFLNYLIKKHYGKWLKV